MSTSDAIELDVRRAAHPGERTAPMSARRASPRNSPIRVGIVADWERCHRSSAEWCAILCDLSDRLVTHHETYRLADRIAQPFFPAAYDVLVVNWDAINGDPDFGADRALTWFEHRHREILAWVYNGGLLIVEGQATDHVPEARAYEAIAGVGEVRLSGVEDRDDPRTRDRRTGRVCRMTRVARRSVFGDLDTIRPMERQRHERMFPGRAGEVLTAELADTDWEITYRGWFRRLPLRAGRLAWVPLIRTADRGRGRNQTTMLGARYGDGAVYMTTMFLAGTGQAALIRALLRTHGNVARLPAPWRLTAFLRRHVVAAVGIPILTAITLSAVISSVEIGWLEQDWFRIVVGAAIAGAVSLGSVGLNALRRFVREVRGV